MGPRHSLPQSERSALILSVRAAGIHGPGAVVAVAGMLAPRAGGIAFFKPTADLGTCMTDAGTDAPHARAQTQVGG